jgi:hypothetical protein
VRRLLRFLGRFLDGPGVWLALAVVSTVSAVLGLLRYALTGELTFTTVVNVALLVFGLWMAHRLWPPRRLPAAMHLVNGDTLPVVAFRVGRDRDGVWHYMIADERGGPLGLSRSEVTGFTHSRPRVRSDTHLFLGVE